MKIESKEIIRDKLSKLMHILRTQETNVLSRLNITSRQLSYLEFISNHYSPTVSNIAKEFQFSKATVTISINQLIQAGYLSKEPSATDKRSFKLKLTEKAWDILNNVNEDRKNTLDKLLNNISQKDALKLAYTLNKIIELHEE